MLCGERSMRSTGGRRAGPEGVPGVELRLCTKRESMTSRSQTLTFAQSRSASITLTSFRRLATSGDLPTALARGFGLARPAEPVSRPYVARLPLCAS